MPTTLPRLRPIVPAEAGAVDGVAPYPRHPRPSTRSRSCAWASTSPLVGLLLPFALSPLACAALYVSRWCDPSARGQLVSTLVPLAFVASFALSLGAVELASVKLLLAGDHLAVRVGPRTVRIALTDLESCTAVAATTGCRHLSPGYGRIELVYVARGNEPGGTSANANANEHERLRRLVVRVRSPLVTSREIALAACRARAPEGAHPTRVVVAVQSRPTLH